MKILIALILFFASFTANADPAPFGLELGKTTIAEAKSKYTLRETGINKYSNGSMFSIDTSEVNFEGLSELSLIFNTNNVLVAVLTKLPKSKFKSLHQSLSKKYKVVSQNIPFVGNSSAKYVNGLTEITLDAPHMSFDMNMNYVRKELIAAYSRQSTQERQAKKRSEESQL